MRLQEEDLVDSNVLSFGFVLTEKYDQHGKFTEIVDVTYNSRMQKFVILDTRGATVWLHNIKPPNCKRELTYPKYQNKLLKRMIYCEKYNIYFAICQDFTLQVFNKDFNPTCKAENPNMRSISHILFNPKLDELITTGMAGTTIWKYQQVESATFDQIKPMANYRLVEKSQHKSAGGLWCTKVEIVNELQQLYFCSETDLYAYSASDVKLLFSIKNAHSATITCAGYSLYSRMLITGSMDTEVKVWGSTGGHVHSFRGHTRPISSLVVHPHTNGLVMTSSLDGSVKVWSLHMMDLLHSYNVFPDGIDWMNITPTGGIWCAASRKLVVLKFNFIAEYWGHARCGINKLEIIKDENKSTRVLVAGDDGSIRLFKQQNVPSNALCTVLPAPVVSLLSTILSLTYSRYNNLFFVLISTSNIWVYTGKTDPACRLWEWNIHDLQRPYTTFSTQTGKAKLGNKTVLNRPTANGSGSAQICDCNCLCAVFSSKGFQYHTDEGMCSAKNRHLLVMGMKDGRLIFMDQLKKSRKYFEISINQAEVNDITQDGDSQLILTKCATTCVQIWKLPNIEQCWKVELLSQPTVYQFNHRFFMSGHANGSVNLYNIKANTNISNGNQTIENYTPTKMEDGKLSFCALTPEHKRSVNSVQISEKRGIFISSSNDGVIKVWSMDYVLMNEIYLDNTLSSCMLLNKVGDLIIGWKKHLFLIDHHTIIPYSACIHSSENSELFENETVIYEDPAVLFESNIHRNKDAPINMETYLVPYNFVLSSGNERLIFDEITASKPKEVDSVSSLDSLHAPTDVYLSHASSLDSINLMCSMLNIKPNKHITNGREISFPVCGKSPGPTPSMSSESEVEIEDVGEEDEDVWMQVQLQNEDDAADDNELKNLRTAVMAATAINKMKGKEFIVPEIGDKNMEEEPLSSRFANTKIDARSMMKKTISAVLAAQRLKSSPRLKQNVEEQPTKPRIQSAAATRQKKMRKPSTTKRISVKSQSMESISTISQDDPSDAIVQIKPKSFYIEGVEAPFGKGVSIPSQQHRRNPTAVALRGTSQGVSKSLGSSSKPSPVKSAATGRKKSLNIKRKSKSAGHLNLHKDKGGKIKQESIVNYTTTGLDSASEVTLDESGKPVTDVYMKYKRPNIFTQNQVPKHKLNQKPSTTEHTANNSPVKNSEARLNSASKRDVPAFVRDFASQMLRQTASTGDCALKQKKTRPKSTTNSKSCDQDRYEIGSEQSIPDLMEFDFQSIYKKDGLQFDESWQERMLERYQLMKLQREQRQFAAANKRIMLQNERQYKILSQRPELLYHDTCAWYEDHAVMSDYILQSHLFTGAKDGSAVELVAKKSPKTPFTAFASHGDAEPPAAAPPSEIERSWSHDCRTPDADRSSADISKKYRFSIRRSTDDNSSIASEEMDRTSVRNSSAPPPSPLPLPSPQRSMLCCKPVSSTKSMQRLLVDRPRSSTSIPGKTRYILLKPEESSAVQRTPSPTKLEEDLLKRRFPAQHHSLMRILRQDDSQQKDGSIEQATREPRRNRSATEPIRSRCPSALSRSTPIRSITRLNETRYGYSKDGPELVLPTAIRDSSLVSVLHRKSSNYVPAAF